MHLGRDLGFCDSHNLCAAGMFQPSEIVRVNNASLVLVLSYESHRKDEAIMTRSLVAAIVLLSAFLSASPIAAEEAPESLVGTWIMTEVTGRTWNGTKLRMDAYSKLELEISEHDGPILSGTYRRVVPDKDAGMHDGKEIKVDTTESFIGVRDFDGTYMVVDHPDTSLFRLKRIDENTIDTVFFEPGPKAVVARTVFKRQ